MKHDVNVDIKPASVSVQAAEKHNKRQLKKLHEKADAGSTMTRNVMGKKVLFKLFEVATKRIERATMVWLDNERDQELLDEHAMAHLVPSFEDGGQQTPAIGRDTCGIFEVADGSCRRYTAMITKQPFFIWIGELSDAQMNYLSEIGNQYKGTSPYEKGRRYVRLLKNATQDEVSKAVGITRKAMMRCVKTSMLPKPFVRSFSSPNELSARKGEAIYKLYESLNEDQQQAAIEFCESDLIPEKATLSTDEIIDLFIAKCMEGKSVKSSAKSEPKPLTENATVIVKNGNARFDVKSVSEESLKAIEKAITEILDREKVNNF